MHQGPQEVRVWAGLWHRRWPWRSTSSSGSTWMTSFHQHPRASPGISLLPVGTRSPVGLGQEGWCPGFLPTGLHGQGAGFCRWAAGFAQLRLSGAEPFSQGVQSLWVIKQMHPLSLPPCTRTWECNALHRDTEGRRGSKWWCEALASPTTMLRSLQEQGVEANDVHWDVLGCPFVSVLDN